MENMRVTVLKLAWPVVVQNLLMTAMLYVDTFMLGRYNPTSLAAMGIDRPILMSIRMVLMALAVGTLATVARAFGECNPAKTRQQAATSLWSGVIVGLVVSLGGALAAPLLLYGVSRGTINPTDKPELWFQALFYLRINLTAFGFSYLFLVGSSILRGCGDTRSPMLIAIYSNIFHIAANYVLIYGKFGFPELGIGGAALSAALSDLMNGVLFLILVFSRRGGIHLKIPDLFKVQWVNFKILIKVSIPAALEPAFIQFGMLVIYGMVVARRGEVTMASHQIVLAIESLSFMPGMGFSVACGALVGQYLGAKRVDLAAAAHRESLKIALLIMTLFGIIFVIFASSLVRIFIDAEASPDILKLSALCLMVGAIEEPFMAWAMIHQGTLRGAGDTRSSAIVAFVGVWVVRLPVAYLLTTVLNWGLVGLWATMPIDWLVRAVVFRILYQRGRWKRIKL